MSKKFYWTEVDDGMRDATPNCNELLTEAEMKRDMARYGTTLEDYMQTDIEVTERQTELENLAHWFQMQDWNGEFDACARDYRHPDNRPYEMTVTECIDQLIAIGEEWRDEYTAPDDDADKARIQRIIDRLHQLRKEYEV